MWCKKCSQPQRRWIYILQVHGTVYAAQLIRTQTNIAMHRLRRLWLWLCMCVCVRVFDNGKLNSHKSHSKFTENAWCPSKLDKFLGHFFFYLCKAQIFIVVCEWARWRCKVTASYQIVIDARWRRLWPPILAIQRKKIYEILLESTWLLVIIHAIR